LVPLLEADSAARPRLLLVGFDRIQPTQRKLFDAWGEWHEVALEQPAAQICYYETADAQTELEACARWSSRQLETNPNARLLIVTQDASVQRGEIERAFLKYTDAASFEFSLGVPISQIALARAAHLLLRWLAEPLQERELDWLFSTGHIAATAQESAALEAAMRTLRRKNLERTHWSFATFVGQHAIAQQLPTLWIERINDAQHLLESFARRVQSPLDWAELLPQLLTTAGWPGARPFSSAEHQATHRWQMAVESCGSLGFDGRRIRWPEFLSVLTRSLDETLFAPESHDAPIQIAGPAESAGLTADAVWFLGADEKAWPASGATHPLLPSQIQRAAGMPHATAQLDWELAHSMTTRVLASAPMVCFSYARQSRNTEARPSRLIAQFADSPLPLAHELQAHAADPPKTILIEDASRIPFAAGSAEGGSSVLTAQSQCPFKAFATTRLAAQNWQPAEAALTASQRGQLLHAVLHAVWGGPPLGIRSLDELQRLPNRKAFVADLVQNVLRNQTRAAMRDQMPRRYLELEAERLTRLVTEWLDFEVTRINFKVDETEAKRTVSIAGLRLNLRLDRVDQLNDGSMLIIDYKSGDVSPNLWELPRPDDVQLPLYAGFGLDGELGGLVFAKVRPGDHSFAGRVGDAKATLLTNLSGTSNLVRNPLTAEQLMDWRDCIEQLAKDFLSGRAEVTPREYPQTCEHCGLEALCRIKENQSLTQVTDGFEEEADE
jgi:probable DNA repair protein